MDCRIGDFKLNLGSDAILLPEFEFRKKFPKQKLKPSNETLEGPDESFDVAGYFVGERQSKDEVKHEEV